jgi:hypothetical protein
MKIKINTYFYRLAWRMKAFSSNVSVTIINRRQYDKNLSNDLNKVFIFFVKSYFF